MATGMTKAHKEQDLSKENELFPTLLIEPWQVDELIAKESIKQRYRLFRLITWIRLCIITTTSAYLAIAKIDILLIIIMVFYALLVFALQKTARQQPDKIYGYSFSIGLLDIVVLTYVMMVVKSLGIQMGILFLSVILSAMLLPLIRTIIIMLLSIITAIISWLGISLAFMGRLLQNPLENIIEIISFMFSQTNINALIPLIAGLCLLALIVNRLASWSFRNDVKAQFRHNQMRQVFSFNRAVIEHLKSGIVVVNADCKIISINRRAVELLDLHTAKPIVDLYGISPTLAQRFSRWLSTGLQNTRPYKQNDGAPEVSLSFSGFGEINQKNIIMITIESINDALQQSQEAKLAALGRLSAGIAHEIRNPLSSINSAAQLLMESSQDLSHQKFSQLIVKNVNRTNQIINDILSLFSDTQAKQQMLEAYETLNDFCREFKRSHNKENFTIVTIYKDRPNLFFFFDPGQLDQILWNLSSNALKYADVDADDLVITLSFELSPNNKNLFIDVYDNGKGIASEQLPKVFEPFYTGSHSGSGLGLYLVRELCSINNATINYLTRKDLLKLSDDFSEETIGAYFRITTQAYFSKNIKPKIT